MRLLAACAVLACGATARAESVRGWVEATTSRWTAGDAVIVTDVVVRAADGRIVTVTEPGGTVDGIGMSFSHRETPRAGDEVVLVAERDGMHARRTANTARRIAPASGGGHVGIQRTSRSSRALYHPSGCLSFVYDARGTARIDGSREWAAFDDAFGAWEVASASQGCGGVKFHREIVTDASDGRDGLNTIRFRDDAWCRPATATDPALCHSPEAAAVTRTLYVDDPSSPRDGEILEVDIEVNGVDFVLAIDGRGDAIDLASVAAHEIGHALGLDHNCGLEDGAWPLDVDGKPVASCESADASLVAATMYFQVQPGTVTMRSPEASDLAGLCAVVDGGCVAEVSGGCTSTRDASSSPLLGGLLLAMILALQIRSRSPRR